MRVASVVALIFPAFLAACASALENPFTVFADPGQYEFLNCEQLAAQRTARKAREQELKLLMDRAEQSAGGAFVNLIAYKSDYVTAQEDLKVIQATARVKKCSTPENWRTILPSNDDTGRQSARRYLGDGWPR
jgi:hypothetical protein